MILEQLDALHDQGLISDLDKHFSRFIARYAAPEDAEPVALAALLASHEAGEGHICVNLPAFAGRIAFSDALHPEPLKAPDWPDWAQRLRRSKVVGRPGDYQPLVLDNHGRLYLYRYWDYEQRLSHDLCRRAVAVDDCDGVSLRMGLKQLFASAAPLDQPDWQKIAAATAVRRRFCVISGGPGTGKTTTVVRILALLSAQYPQRMPDMALAAPTGKAAARLQEAITQARQQLHLSPEQQAAIPAQATTIHRLLGARSHSVYFHHNRNNPLKLDVLVVDEALDD